MVISGRVVRFETRQAGSKWIGSLDVSVADPYKQGSGKDRTYSYFSVDIWEPSETLVNQLSVPKTKVVVAGRLKQDSWTNKEGKKQSKIKIVASDVAVLEEVQAPQTQADPEPEPEPEPAPKPAPRPVQTPAKPATRPAVAVRRPAPAPPPVEEEPEATDDDQVPF